MNTENVSNEEKGNGVLADVLSSNKEWGKWECPTCGDKCEDTEDVWETTCSNGHNIRLGAIHNGCRDAQLLVIA